MLKTGDETILSPLSVGRQCIYTAKTNEKPVTYESALWLYGMEHIPHYDDVIMTTMASQITSLTVVYSTVYSDADRRKHQSFASLTFVWGIHRDRRITRTKASYAENVSIWWRHHVLDAVWVIQEA